MAGLFPGLSAQAQGSLALGSVSFDHAFVSGRDNSITLPAATGGTPPYTYSLSVAGGLSRDNLSFDPSTRVLSGNPPDSSMWSSRPFCSGVPCLTRTITYTVTDDTGATASRANVDFHLIDYPDDFLPTPDNLNFDLDTAITPVTLDPTTSDNNNDRSYALTGLPSGLSFNPATRVLSGTPDTAGVTTVTYTSTTNTWESDITHTVTFSITVGDPPDPLALGQLRDNYAFDTGKAVTFALPAATGGTPPYTYSLSRPGGASLSSDGLSFDPSSRDLSGIPPASSQWGGTQTCSNVTCAIRGFTYTVTDDAGNTAQRTGEYRLLEIPFRFLPTPDDLNFTRNTAITPVTLPKTVDDQFTYRVSQLPPGLSFDTATRVLSGTPTETGTMEVTYTATGHHWFPVVTRSVKFDITVADLVLPTQAPLGFAANTPASVTLPAATGGTPPYTYSLLISPNRPLRNGLSFDPSTRVLSGAVPDSGEWIGATAVCDQVGGVVCQSLRLDYEVTDDAGATVAREIELNLLDYPPEFLPAQDDLNFTPGTAISPVTLQQTASQGSVYAYALTGLPPGLSFDPSSRVLSGTPTTEGTTTVTYSATHTTSIPTLAHTVTFDIIVADLAPPAQGDVAFVVDRHTSVTLAAATGGIPPYTYALTGPNGEDVGVAVPGLSFDPDTRVLSGTPTEKGVTTLTYTATDSAGTPASVTRAFDFTVTGVSIAEVDDQTYEIGVSIDSLTLPEATGGTAPYTYALTGPNGTDLSEVPGLTFDPATRVLSGTPTEAGTTRLTYTVTDSEDNATFITFDVTVTESDDGTVTGPISIAEVGARTYAAGEDIDQTLPEATGGTAPYTYTLTGPNGMDLSEVPGLTFDPATRVLSGIPTEAGTTRLTYTVTDSEDNATIITFDVTVTESDDGTVTGPISIAEVDARTYAAGEDVDRTLPEATGGTAPYTYTLTGPNGTDLSEVPGLFFDPDTRELSGTPTRAGTTTLTYTVTDSEGNATFITFDVIVTGPKFDTDADAEVEETVEDSYKAGAVISLTLPEASGKGVTYALTNEDGKDVSVAVPGLSFDAATRVLSGTPTRTGITTLTYTATDEYGNDTTLATFDVTVTGPMFVDAAAVDEVEGRTYEYAVDVPIASLKLPEATSDTGDTVTYALTGPNGTVLRDAVPGLSFDPDTRELSGIPTRVGTTTLTYEAKDSEGTISMEFTVTVTSAVPAALNEVLLPEVVRAMAGSTVGAIARRIGQAARGAEATGLSVGGQDGWAALRTHGEAVSEGRRGFEELLSGSGFVLPLDAAAAGAAMASSVALWGSGEYRSLSGESGTLGWDGALVGVHLGVDARPHEDLLAGVAVSWLSSDLDYEDATAVVDGGFGGGAHVAELTGVHPYLGWRAGEVDVWATAGLGAGELEVTPTGRDGRASDLGMRTVGVGGSGVLLERGVNTVRLKGEAMYSALEVDESVHVEGVEVEATRVRMTVEAGQTHTLADGGVLEPSLEAGVRHDGGDGETGTGAEVGGGLSYRHRYGRITAEGRVRALVAGYGEHEEWGIEGHLAMLPGAGGRGLSLSVRPGYGDSGEGGFGQLWRREGVSDDGDNGAEDYRARLETRLGYGVFLPGYTGVFTPYTGMTVGAAEGYRIGVSWKAGSRIDLDLVGERRESGGGPAEHALVLRGEVRF